jgi:glycosyltransferase involved in cell wall biosynthesis
MANCGSTPYFIRFAEIVNKLPEKYSSYKFSFIMVFKDYPVMIEEMKAFGMDCYWIPFDAEKRKSGLLKAFFKAYKLLKKLKPDVVNPHLFDDSLPVLLAAWLLGVKARVISKLDTGFHAIYMPSMIKFDKLNNWLSHKLIAVSEENKEMIIATEGVDPNKIELVYMGVPLEEVVHRDENIQKGLKKKFSLDGSKKVVLTVARYIDIKGYKVLLNALKEICDKRSDVLFINVGSGGYGSIEEYQQMANDLGVQDHIIFGGKVSREEVYNLYAISDVYLHSSISEPWGYAIAEAMANEIPMVATNTGGARDALVHMDSGYIIKPDNVEEMVAGVEYCIDNDVQYMAENAYKILLEMYNVPSMLDNHIKLYEKLLNN